jgi:DUF4097 and DUF4098 domain-containing protein YvlB
VDCRVVSGGIQVSDVKGDVDLTTVSGGITASRIKDSIDAAALRIKAFSGSIDIRKK